jgi:hypothetical protein
MQPGIRSRWMRNGAIAGVALAASDLAEWRGPKYLPWEGEGIALNISMIGGYVLGGMLLFFLAASARRAFTKEP